MRLVERIDGTDLLTGASLGEELRPDSDNSALYYFVLFYFA
jgi:hypothetical protein